MSRHGRVVSEIWSDKTFIALTAHAQRMYLLLLSQPDIEMSGVIPLRERRWARTASDIDLQNVWNDLKELHDARFILIDEEAGELLVRSYMRRNEVFLQPYPMVSAGRSLAAVTSEPILRAVAIEIDRILAENTDLFRMSNGLKPLTDRQKWGVASFLQDFRAKDPDIFSTIRALAWENQANGDPSTDPSTEGPTDPSTEGSPKGLSKGRVTSNKERSYVTDRRKKASPPATGAEGLFDEPITDEVAPQRRGPMPRRAFQTIYDRWPRKGAPDTALKTFDQLLRKEKVNQAQLEVACENYIREMTGDRFAKQMNTFLREGDWRDWVLKTAASNPSNRPRCPEHRAQLAHNCPFHSQPEEPDDPENPA